MFLPRGPMTLFTFLLSASALNITYLGLHYWRETSEAGKFDGHHSYRGHDYPESLPLGKLASVLMVDEETVHYPVLGYASDPEWFSLADEEVGSGYIRLGPEDRIFAVSMFHQLHCLRIINLAFSKAPISTPTHLHHCLNYLRQGALCNADISLEPGDFEKRDFTLQRTGATHICQDWTKVYDVMKQGQHSWESKIGGTHAESKDTPGPV